MIGAYGLTPIGIAGPNIPASGGAGGVGGALVPSVTAPEIIAVPDNESPYDEPELTVYSILKNQPALHYSSGVYTHSSGDYYLINISNGTVRAAKLLFDASIDSFREKYRTDYPSRSVRSGTIGESSDQISFETYLLSRATQVSAWVEIGTYRTTGSPFAYGWNFNWNGSEAVCVTHKSNVDAYDVLQDWTARMYTLTITEVATPELLEATVSVAASVWQPDTGNPHVFYPTSDGRMYPWLFVGCSQRTADNYGEGGFSAPLSAFYTATGEMDVLSYTQEALPDQSIAELILAGRMAICSECGGNAIAGPGYQSIEYEGWIDGREISIKTTSGGLWEDVDAGGGHYRRRQIWIDSENEITYREAGFLEDWFEGGTRTEAPSTYDRANIKTGTVEILNEFSYSSGSDYTRTLTPVIIYPRHSTESVYVCWGSLTYRRITKSDARATGTQIYLQALNSSNVPLGGFLPVYYPALSDRNCVAGQPGTVCEADKVWVFFDLGVTLNAPNPVTNVNEYVHKAELSIVTPYEITEVDVVEADTFEGLGIYGGLIAPPLCTDSADLPYLINYQSVLGNSLRSKSPTIGDFDSNCSIDASKAEPWAFWLGRS